jgi:hypothetical protein
VPRHIAVDDWVKVDCQASDGHRHEGARDEWSYGFCRPRRIVGQGRRDDGADLGSSVMAVCSIFELRRRDARYNNQRDG